MGSKQNRKSPRGNPKSTGSGSSQTGSRQDAGGKKAGSTGVELQSIEHEGQDLIPGVEGQIA